MIVIDQLPFELAEEIIKLLDVKSLKAVSLVNSYLHEISLPHLFSSVVVKFSDRHASLKAFFLSRFAQYAKSITYETKGFEGVLRRSLLERIPENQRPGAQGTAEAEGATSESLIGFDTSLIRRCPRLAKFVLKFEGTYEAGSVCGAVSLEHHLVVCLAMLAHAPRVTTLSIGSQPTNFFKPANLPTDSRDDSRDVFFTQVVDRGLRHIQHLHNRMGSQLIQFLIFNDVAMPKLRTLAYDWSADDTCWPSLLANFCERVRGTLTELEIFRFPMAQMLSRGSNRLRVHRVIGEFGKIGAECKLTKVSVLPVCQGAEQFGLELILQGKKPHTEALNVLNRWNFQ